MTDTVDFSDSVRVRNTGTATIGSSFNGRPYRINPGQDALLPRVAAMTWLGDWTRRDDEPWFPRTEELSRIKGKFGALDDEGLWEVNRPHVEIYEMDGRRVTLLWEDPEGASLPADGGGPTLEQQFRSMQEHLARLQAQLEAAGEGAAVEDSPETARRRRVNAPRIEAAEEESA